MNFLKSLDGSIVLQNKYVKIELDKKDARVLSVTDKDGKSIMGESVPFLNLTDDEWNIFEAKGLSLVGDTLLLDTVVGSVSVRVLVLDTHFELEVVSHLPEKAYCLNMGCVKYEYDFNDRTSYRGVGVAQTIKADPRYFPDGYPKTTFAKVYEHLGDGAVGAKYALAILPEPKLRDALKIICSRIDPEKGIVLKSAGPWSDENRLARGSYAKANDCRRKTIEITSKIYKRIGVDQVFFQQNAQNTFHQGNFTYAGYKDDADFKSQVVDFLNKEGIEVGLHTYAQYINFECADILSDPKYQEMIIYGEEYTLAEDITENADFIPTVESTENLSSVYGFFETNMPLMLIGQEFVRYTNHPHGFDKCMRGYSGTTPVAHRKGEKIRHALGCFGKLAPVHSSELFLLVARNTARAFNLGGYSMIYLDAIDGTVKHVKKEERPYYIALFVHEILKNCDREPLLELSDMPASVWAARARMGAWDMPFRNYKIFNTIHHKDNLLNARRCYHSTLGWYNYFPIDENYPGNQHTRYQHSDDVDHMGALSVMYDYSTVFNGGYDIDRYAGCLDNINRYNFYTKLRQEKYFPESLLEKARANPRELAIIQKGKKYFFVEKNYEKKRLFGINEEGRNKAELVNPFKKQTPFIRIEMGLTSFGDDRLVVLPMNESLPVLSQLKRYDFGASTDLSKRLAFKVRVKGNGKKGSLGIKFRSGVGLGGGYGLYVIDTDFEGLREFTLVETDNGARGELLFEEEAHHYMRHRHFFNMKDVRSVEILTSGDCDGVYMSSVEACPVAFDVVKNPTLKIGESEIIFECELKSSDFLEWDGERARVFDRYRNSKEVYFSGGVSVPHGRYTAYLSGTSLNGCPVNAILTVGTEGKIIK